MKIPDMVKIGGHWFNIKIVHEDDGFDITGKKYGWINKIFLQGKAIQSKQESTLFHEIIHEIDWQNNLSLSEQQTSTIAESMYQVLIDNGWLK